VCHKEPEPHMRPLLHILWMKIHKLEGDFLGTITITII
jgi:hypothetical protein